MSWQCSPILTESLVVNDFDAIPALLRHTLDNGLRVDPSEHPILMTEPAWNTPANRERLAEIMFEEFKVPAFYIANTGVLTAYVVFSSVAVVHLTKYKPDSLPVRVQHS